MITIGITTYNRKNILKKMAKSLYSSDLKCEYNIRVYDDASTEYDKSYLREVFPNAVIIHAQSHNIGSDGNIRYMYEDFLKSDDDYFVNADSDLIFNKDWMNVMVNLIDLTDGVLSAFNVTNPIRHKEINVCTINGIELVEKYDIGSAGTMFTRETVEQIVSGLSDFDSTGFDWKWSKLLREKGKKIYTLKNSLVQHIGFTGFNSMSGDFDYGDHFIVDSLDNGQAINDAIADVSSNKLNNIRKRISLFPFSDIPKGSRIIIYGAGVYGMDYYRQVKSIDYCKVVALCDAEFSKMDGVIDPQKITLLDYDYIVISVRRDDSVDEIKRYLYQMGIQEDKVIAGCGERIIEIN